jgi:hypothetical protein
MNQPAKSPLALPEGYADWLAQLKGQIAHARQRAALAVNAELVHPGSTVRDTKLPVSPIKSST